MSYSVTDYSIVQFLIPLFSYFSYETILFLTKPFSFFFLIPYSLYIKNENKFKQC